MDKSDITLSRVDNYIKELLCIDDIEFDNIIAVVPLNENTRVFESIFDMVNKNREITYGNKVVNVQIKVINTDKFNDIILVPCESKPITYKHRSNAEIAEMFNVAVQDINRRINMITSESPELDAQIARLQQKSDDLVAELANLVSIKTSMMDRIKELSSDQ